MPILIRHDTVEPYARAASNAGQFDAQRQLNDEALRQAQFSEQQRAQAAQEDFARQQAQQRHDDEQRRIADDDAQKQLERQSRQDLLQQQIAQHQADVAAHAAEQSSLFEHQGQLHQGDAAAAMDRKQADITSHEKITQQNNARAALGAVAGAAGRVGAGIAGAVGRVGSALAKGMSDSDIAAAKAEEKRQKDQAAEAKRAQAKLDAAKEQYLRAQVEHAHVRWQTAAKGGFDPTEVIDAASGLRDSMDALDAHLRAKAEPAAPATQPATTRPAWVDDEAIKSAKMDAYQVLQKAPKEYTPAQKKQFILEGMRHMGYADEDLAALGAI